MVKDREYFTIPPLLIGTSLLFWGFQRDLLLLSIVLGLVYESSNLFTFKWSSYRDDIVKVVDGTLFIFASALIFLFIYDSDSIYHNIGLYAPIVLYPITLLSRFGERKINLKDIFILTRKRVNKNTQERYLSFEPILLFITLLSAGGSPKYPQLFFPLIIIIILIIILHQRSKQIKLIYISSILLSIILISFMFQITIRTFQKDAKARFIDWMVEHFAMDSSDPFKSKTSIGKIRGYKNSSKIVVRVESDASISLPKLLKESSYDFYRDGEWSLSNREFISITRESRGWKLLNTPKKSDLKTIKIYTDLSKKDRLLKYPFGTTNIDNIDASRVERGRLGSILLTFEDEIDSYKLKLDETIVSIKEEINYSNLYLYLPHQDTLVVDNFISHYKLKEIENPFILLDSIKTIFSNNYRYSLDYHIKESEDMSDLTHFLEISKIGHCEYFATASTLILRRLGYPARYSVGYAVQEFSTTENRYIARASDAHGWCEIYIGGAWYNFDPTPPDWHSLEQDQLTIFTTIRDIISWGIFKFNRLREDGESTLVYAIVISSILILYFIIRVLLTRGRKRDLKLVKKDYLKLTYSDLYLKLEKVLDSSDQKRYRWESVEEWLTRIGEGYSKETKDHLLTIGNLFNIVRYSKNAEERVVSKLLDEIERLRL